jgi:hypothetical protein
MLMILKYGTCPPNLKLAVMIEGDAAAAP